MIGDSDTAALVGLDGSIDWLCLPRFDSDSCFARLVGDEANGYWRIAPRCPRPAAERRYRDGTLVLKTTFSCDTGKVRIIDFMPPKAENATLVRIVDGLEGTVDMVSELVVRFEYGISVPWASKLTSGALSLVAGAALLVLHADVPTHGKDFKTLPSRLLRVRRRATS